MTFNKPSDQFLMENMSLWDPTSLSQLFINDCGEREIYSPNVENISMDEDNDSILVQVVMMWKACKFVLCIQIHIS